MHFAAALTGGNVPSADQSS